MNEAGIETLGMVYQGFRQGVGDEVSANIECVQESLWRRQKMPRHHVILDIWRYCGTRRVARSMVGVYS